MRQMFEYLKNKKRFLGEKTSIFYNYARVIICWIKEQQTTIKTACKVILEMQMLNRTTYSPPWQVYHNAHQGIANTTNKRENVANTRDLYTMDVTLFQPTNFFKYSLQWVIENSYPANALKYLHTACHIFKSTQSLP